METKTRTKSFSDIAKEKDEKELSEELGFDVSDSIESEKAIFYAVNEDQRPQILNILQKHPSPTTILQILLTATYPNQDHFYTHDPEVLIEADELLGHSLENINAIQIACILGEEDIAMDILEYVARMAEEIDSRIVLYEFMGRMWGEGNTILHLASFMGMDSLVAELIKLGAATGKSNFRNYKPVDCAGDDLTRDVFETVTELDKSKRLNRNLNGARTSTDFSSISSLNLVHSPVLETNGASNGHSEQSSISSPHSIRVDATLPNRPSSFTPPARTGGKNGSKTSSTTKISETKSDSAEILNSKPSRLTDIKKGVVHSLSLGNTRKSSLKSLNQKEKCVKKVGFDPKSTLLYLCHYADTEGIGTHLDQVKSCVEQIKSANNGLIDVNNIYLPQQWLSPLHIACSHGHLEIAKYLLEEANAAVNIVDIEGWTPLHCAAAEGHLDIIKLLGSCHGSLFDESKDNKEILYIFDGPIDLEPLNDDNELPEDVALESKEADIKELLIELRNTYSRLDENLERVIVPPFITESPEKVSPPHLTPIDPDSAEKELEAVPSSKTLDFSQKLKRALSVVKPVTTGRSKKKDENQNNDTLPSPMKLHFDSSRKNSIELKDSAERFTLEKKPSIEEKTTISMIGSIESTGKPIIIVDAPSPLQNSSIPTKKIEAATNETEINSPSDPGKSDNLTLKINTESPEPDEPPSRSESPRIGEPRRIRRVSSITRGRTFFKLMSEIESQRSPVVGEMMKRPIDLQRRISNTRKKNNTPANPGDIETKSIGSVSSIKNSFSQKYQETIDSNPDRVQPRMISVNSTIQDKIKQFQKEKVPNGQMEPQKGR